MGKKKKKVSKKEMSEGQTIAVAVLVFTGVVVAFAYGIKFLIDYLV